MNSIVDESVAAAKKGDIIAGYLPNNIHADSFFIKPTLPPTRERLERHPRRSRDTVESATRNEVKGHAQKNREDPICQSVFT